MDDVEHAPEPSAHWEVPRLLIPVLGAVSLAVVILDPLVRYGLFRVHDAFLPVLPFVAVAGEGNLPTWWSVALLVSVAWAMLAVAARGDTRGRRGWAVAAAVVGLLSLDELASLHERMGPVAQELLDSAGLSIPTYAWLLPGVVIAAVGLVVGLMWARGLPGPSRRRLVAGLLLFVGGAVGLEATAGLLKNTGHRPAYYLATLAEESCEMVGAAVVLGAPLQLLRGGSTSGRAGAAAGARRPRSRVGATEG